MEHIIILWNSVNDNFEDIVIDLESDGVIIQNHIRIELDDEIASFIKDIYNYDELPEKWRVDLKIDYIEKLYNSRIVDILYVFTSKDIKCIKNKIRLKYSRIIDRYKYDNIIHITDDNLEYVKALNAVNKYVCKKGKVKKL